ncbi:hypothetical protein A2872_02225 [Candidatus Gottesmanbacteria bacterium RIFCSPHIGHO2_01_FULL_42_12]|uniref:Galactose-1-phosphate uridyl transferase N-terminal domain-containing protein n=1 Tax=Candidatus Gottesmanbacteria bacterium RIFCSPHIGHO2_01_FULL_42_12 TaxID=1798377 RepID=A0A1F5Z6G5_9BACT|nr:MAG: hypothetical protein A2872_02225 [Candidatus Gottesmanbacteria bacterium RIFCSPHIGHO2_01_FULL_42_12]
MKFVADILNRRYLLISEKRKRYKPPTVVCPFCPKSGEHWELKTFRNDFPLTDIHEVIIHSPDHLKDIDELPHTQVEQLLKTYKDRYNRHKYAGKVLIFQNHNAHAGASVVHPHSQLVVFPDSSPYVSIPKEPVANVILETKGCLAYCPEYSEWPYEVWLAPKSQMDGYGSITDEQVYDVAVFLKLILQAMTLKFEIRGEMRKLGATREIPYNFYISPEQEWYIRIIPRLKHLGGFELGSGIMVNTVSPKTAAQEYKKDLGLQL